MGKRRNKDNDIIISCIGKSQTQVTGTSWSIVYKKDDSSIGTLILECGLPQGDNTIEKSYNSMKRMVEDIKGDGLIESCENLLFLHPHVDHTGLIPIFNSDNGFKGNIYSSKESIPITKELLKDCCFIQKKNVQYIKSKGKKATMLYTEPQMYDCFEHMKVMEVGKKIEIDSNLSIELRYNSHTVGSCNATIYIRKPSNNRIYTIGFSSDMGSKLNKQYSNYLKEQDIPKRFDIFISEGTYSSSNRVITSKMVKQEREEFIEIIKNGLLEGKRILLPTFAFSRSQQIVTTLYNSLKDEDWFNEGEFNIIMDGVLMNNINTTYSRVLEDEDKGLFDNVMQWDRLKKITTFDGTMAFLSKREPCVIIASSGFLENGKVMTYLPEILGNSKDIIMLTGYCSQDNEGSMGWKLLNPNQKTITFSGKEKRTVLKRATIYQQKSWTSHISNQELKELFSSLNCDKIIVHHCSEGNKEQFIKECKEYLRSKNKTTPIVATSKCCNQFIL